MRSAGRLHPRSELADRVGDCLARLRDERPRVHVLTNFVAMNISANVLLAVGAVPSMTFRPDAMPDFLVSSAALVVNLGMLDAERKAAIRRAAPLARELGRPWVLDPVKVDRSGARRDLALSLLEQGPAVLRANAGELLALAGKAPDIFDDVGHTARHLSRHYRCVVAATGPVDFVTDGERTARLDNGTPLLDRVTAMGCALSALMGAFLAVERDAWLASATCVAVFGIAGEIAAERSRGPGSFVPELLDALYALDARSIETRLRQR